MGTPKQAKADILSTLRALGMDDGQIRRSGNAVAIAALNAEAEVALAGVTDKVAAQNEQALKLMAALDAYAKKFERDPQTDAELLGVSLAAYSDAAPAVVALYDLLHPATSKKSHGSGDGARATVEWEVLAGLQPMWLAITGKGKDGRPSKSAPVYYVESPLVSGENGRVTWRTKVLSTEERSLSKAFSTTGRIRPTRAAETAIYHAAGRLEQYAQALSVGGETVTTEDLLAEARAAGVGYAILPDLGDPETMSATEVEKAFANRIGIDLVTL